LPLEQIAEIIFAFAGASGAAWSWTSLQTLLFHRWQRSNSKYKWDDWVKSCRQWLTGRKRDEWGWITSSMYPVDVARRTKGWIIDDREIRCSSRANRI
jgi:hypothetical protein